MDKRLVFGVFLLVCAAGLSACHGASTIPTAPAQANNQASAIAPALKDTAPLVIALPSILVPKAAPSLGAKPDALSPATRSIAGTIGSLKFGPMVLGQGVKGCVLVDANLNCTITERAPIGKDDVVIRSYATSTGSGPVLAIGRGDEGVAAGQINYATPLGWYGVAKKLALNTNPAELYAGQSGTAAVHVNGIDAANAPIPSRSVIGPNGQIVGGVSYSASGPYGDQSITTAPTPPKQLPNTNAIFTYNGQRTGTETFTVRAAHGGLAPATISITLVPRGSGTPQIFVGKVTGSGLARTTTIAEYGSNAVGNAEPMISVVLYYQVVPEPFGASTSGSFWAPLQYGITQYSSAGKTLDSIAPVFPVIVTAATYDPSGNLYLAEGTDNTSGSGTCILPPGESAVINEYAASSNGTVLMRSITPPSTCNVPLVSVDGLGDIWLVEYTGYAGMQSTLLEYGPHASGNASPLLDVALGGGGSESSAELDQNLVTDPNGNAYVLGDEKVRGFGPSAAHSPLLSLEHVFAIAMDSSGDAYAITGGDAYSGAAGATLSEYVPGSNTPTRTISGPNTQLSTGPVRGMAVLP